MELSLLVGTHVLDFVPSGTSDNSPAIHRWEGNDDSLAKPQIPSRQKSQGEAPLVYGATFVVVAVGRFLSRLSDSVVDPFFVRFTTGGAEH